MSAQKSVTIPHKLGREEVRRRIERGIGKLASRIPGGVATVDYQWMSEERLSLVVQAVGAKVPCTVDIADEAAVVVIKLSGMLSLLSGPITSAVEEQGRRYLS